MIKEDAENNNVEEILYFPKDKMKTIEEAPDIDEESMSWAIDMWVPASETNINIVCSVIDSLIDKNGSYLIVNPLNNEDNLMFMQTHIYKDDIYIVEVRYQWSEYEHNQYAIYVDKDTAKRLFVHLMKTGKVLQSEGWTNINDELLREMQTKEGKPIVASDISGLDADDIEEIRAMIQGYIIMRAYRNGEDVDKAKIEEIEHMDDEAIFKEAVKWGIVVTDPLDMENYQ